RSGARSGSVAGEGPGGTVGRGGPGAGGQPRGRRATTGGRGQGGGVPRRPGEARHPGQRGSQSPQRTAGPEARMILHGLEGGAVLFDCDGVLVDSEPVSFQAWSITLANHGYVLDEPAFAESVGGTETMVAERYAPVLGVDPVALEAEAQ